MWLGHVAEHVAEHAAEHAVFGCYQCQTIVDYFTVSCTCRLFMSTAIPAILEALRLKTRKPRKECEYNVEERAVLDKYKKQYKAKTSAEEREMMLRNYILVDIFNHWHAKGIDLSEEEVPIRMKV
jgi:hypothetical protein